MMHKVRILEEHITLTNISCVTEGVPSREKYYRKMVLRAHFDRLPEYFITNHLKITIIQSGSNVH